MANTAMSEGELDAVAGGMVRNPGYGILLSLQLIGIGCIFVSVGTEKQNGSGSCKEFFTYDKGQ